MAFSSSVSASLISVSIRFNRQPPIPRLLNPSASLSKSSSSKSPTGTVLSSNNPSKSIADLTKTRHDPSLNYVLSSPNGKPAVGFSQAAESFTERMIFNFRFMALLAVGGSLAGSVLLECNNYIYRINRGSVYIVEAYKIYWSSCVKGIHTGQMVLRLVEAIDVYLVGTVMLIFAMGLYGLFISNESGEVQPSALKGSSLFGMFALKERPTWMKICSLDELKTKVGHVIVMILLVKMFEKSKMVSILTGTDLLSYSICIFLSSASLYILHNLHKGDCSGTS